MTKVDKLELLGFKITDGYEALYTHENFNDLTVDMSQKNGSIRFPEGIIVNDRTTSNLSKEETFVVLECVIKLLNLGYSRNCIELEKTWELGTSEKGKLDILVKDVNDKSYAMIECKTKKEFSKTWDKMLKDGKERKSQLFSYYQQDKNANLLILYTFDFEDSKMS